MTPEPEPEPEPVPKYSATITNTLNNSFMFRILEFTGAWTPVAGGVSSITDPAVIQFELVDGVTSDTAFRVSFKAYDNTHPDWNDSYYDDSNQAVQSGGVSNIEFGEYTNFAIRFNGINAPQIAVTSRS